jgi:hypothetical protein
MKAFIFISFVILAVLLFKSVKAKTEIQKYEVIFKKGSFEIRYYPEAILASVSSNGTYDNSRNSSFRVLAGYIFGGNTEEQKIAMTAPVRMSTTGEQSTMSFVLPSHMEFEDLPEPLSSRVILHESKPVIAAAIRYGGYTNDREIEARKIELREILNEMEIEFKNNFEYLGYNPPYQMFNRRNEILVELSNFDRDGFSSAVASKE